MLKHVAVDREWLFCKKLSELNGYGRSSSNISLQTLFLDTSNGAFGYPTLAALLNQSCDQETQVPQIAATHTKFKRKKTNIGTIRK